MLIGLGEGVITTLVVAAVAAVRPELLAGRNGNAAPPGYRQFAVYGLLVAVGLALFVSPFATSWPDGLERVAARLGFEHRASPAGLASPLPDYAVPGVSSAVASTMVAGIAGTLAAFVLALVLARVLTPSRGPRSADRRRSGSSSAP